MRCTLLVAAFAIGLAGCGSPPTRVGEPVAVSGKVTFADGSPVKNVLLVLNPVEKGRPDNLKIGPDGSFSGNAVPGKYAFYFAPQDGKPAAMRTIPEKYRANQIEQLVTISGGDVTITLE